ncbi:WD_REPEATS_REGION domain-containing protein [Mortierella sp. 14UC]|nr:WD_REPEATS_REGION domain-containing protein [Mortierella sp. 14UC]
MTMKATEAQDMCRQINTNYAGMEQSIKGKRRIDHDDDTYNSTIKRLNLEDDVGQELLRIRTDRMASHHQPVFIPPFAKADARAQDNDLFLLVDKVKEFLVSERETMLILGDSGAGKSTFISRLEYELWSEFKTGEPVPLFVNLPSIERPEHGLIAKQLGRLDVSTEHIQALKRDGRQFTVICDGYDESQLTLNLHATNQFNRPGQWRAKLIVTCRSQYLSQSYRDRFVPLGGSHYSRPALHLYQEAAIAPFSKEQVKNYVDIYVPLEPRTWTTQDYMDRLTAIPHLMDLVRNPFLLTLTLESLPGVTKDKQDLSTIKITRLQLYDIFVVHWLEVNKRRLESSTLSFRDRDAMDQLLEADFVSKGIGYCTGLASGIFTHQDGKPIVQYVHLDDRNSWKAEFFCPDPEVQLLRNSSPLTRTGHLYRFMHRSMLEYFLSRAIFEPSISNDYDEFAPQQDSDSSVIQSLDTNGPLFTQDLLKEPSVLQFLYERVPTSPIFKKQLLAVLEQSKSDSGYSRAAANAITILVKARVSGSLMLICLVGNSTLPSFKEPI